MTAIVTTGSALALPFNDDSVELIVTSPPYYTHRRYETGHGETVPIGQEAKPSAYIDSLVAATAEMARVLRSDGSIFVNLGDKYDSDGSLMMLPERFRIAVRDDLRLVTRSIVVWSKPNGLPDTARDRVQRAHEDWVHLTKSRRYFCDIDAIRVPHVEPDRVRADVFGGRSAELGVRHAGPTTYTGPADRRGKVPSSVWSISTQALRIPPAVAHAVCCAGVVRPGCRKGVEHFAAFPPEWPRRLIRGWCPPGGLVVDPFGGSGTTALVADLEGRVGVSVDVASAYVPLARWRVTDPGERARAAVERPDGAPVRRKS